MEGLIVFDHFDRADEFRNAFTQMLRVGDLASLETVKEGFEDLPKFFASSFGGDHIGKLVVKI